MRIRFHKEGTTIILTTTIVLGVVNYLAWKYWNVGFYPILAVSTLVFGLVIQFFRNPEREVLVADDNIVYAPADGKVCVIEEVIENEYFKDKRLQVSIFMSPLNVHVNRNPVSGVINYFRYHPGKYLVAWHPKSSVENERTTTVIETENAEILMRQIAGALAKRIKYYVNEGDQVEQGKDMGFIKFGSRVDLYLPIGTKIEVELNQKVKGNTTIIAHLKGE
jgi:phosphatidylserine decarboxylase